MNCSFAQKQNYIWENIKRLKSGSQTLYHMLNLELKMGGTEHFQPKEIKLNRTIPLRDPVSNKDPVKSF